MCHKTTFGPGARRPHRAQQRIRRRQFVRRVCARRHEYGRQRARTDIGAGSSGRPLYSQCGRWTSRRCRTRNTRTLRADRQQDLWASRGESPLRHRRRDTAACMNPSRRSASFRARCGDAATCGTERSGNDALGPAAIGRRRPLADKALSRKRTLSSHPSAEVAVRNSIAYSNGVRIGRVCFIPQLSAKPLARQNIG
jgi:hypothetical protein